MSDNEMDEESGVDRRAGLSIIANPLASEKLASKTLKLVRKAAKAKSVRRGVKECVKALRKKEKGVMVIAGNITPIDVICHIPILCEQADIPYIYVPSKEELGAASATKRPTSCILVVPKKDADWLEAYEKVKKAVKKVQPTY